MNIAKKRNRAGRHFLVDFFGVDEEKLKDRDGLMLILCHSLKRNGFRVLREAGSHKFEGGGEGVTGFALLSESHAAFHSYPEYGYMALDIYSCGDHDPELVAREFEEQLKPKEVISSLYKRGPSRPYKMRRVAIKRAA